MNCHDSKSRPQRVGLFPRREPGGMGWAQWDGRFWRDPETGETLGQQDAEWQDLSEES